MLFFKQSLLHTSLRARRGKLNLFNFEQGGFDLLLNVAKVNDVPSFESSFGLVKFFY
jgi:hypothetical protein